MPQIPPPFGGAPSPGVPGIPGLPSPFHDVSQDLAHHWQMVDGACRIIKRALATGGFYKQPEARAHLQEHVRGLDHLIHEYSRAGDSMGPNKSTSTPSQRGDDDVEIEPAADTDEHEGT